MQAPHPERLDRFQIRRKAGEGGFGEVFEAYDPRLDRTVALKRLRRGGLTDEALRDLRSEAFVTARLEHPGIVPLYEIVEQADDLLLVMRWVRGPTVRELLDRCVDEGPASWPLGRRLALFVQICLTVDYAHDRGVLHRDLKPENIMVGAYGETLLLDWGVASLVKEAASSASLLGTPGYVSPEQSWGSATVVSDVWSLGAILVELVTLRPAFEGSPQTLLLAPQLHPPRIEGRGIPDELTGICARALAERPEDRFESARRLADAVTAFIDGTERRRLATEMLTAARTASDQYQVAIRDAETAATELEERKRATPRGSSLEVKAPLFELSRRLRSLEKRGQVHRAEAIARAEAALVHDPGHPEVRRFLAAIYWRDLVRARDRRDVGASVFFEQRVRAYDDGELVRRLDSPGRVRVGGRGAEARVYRVDRSSTLWSRTPVDVVVVPTRLELPPGDYQIELCGDGVHATIPVRVQADAELELGEIPLVEAPTGWCHVPDGPCTLGGDPTLSTQLETSNETVPGFLIQELPVTMGAYEAFLHDLSLDEARARCPRRESGLDAPGAPYWDERDGRMWVPELDADGDRWSRDFPVFSISWHDAVAYCAWISARTGVEHRLPTEQQWEKAGRGSDGRLYPWGDAFDAALCKMEASRPGRPQPEVVGAFATDRSPYGVRDLAGGVREWCSSAMPERGTRVVRGGGWLTSARPCRLANRFGFEPHVCRPYIGFRMVRSL